MKVAIVQYDPVWENKTANQQKIKELLETLTESVSFIIFPEMTLTGFTMRSRSFAEKEQGKTIGFFSRLAKKYHANVIGGYIKDQNGHYLNTLVHLDTNGFLIGEYFKIHPFSFSGENRFYRSGSLPVSSENKNIKIGYSICYDLRFPELFRHYAKSGVNLMVNIANWPETRINHWSQLLIARAIENQCYMIGVNRIGWDKKNHYNGRSMVIDPLGETLIELEDLETIAVVDVDLSKVAKVRNIFPFLTDMKLI